MWPFPTMGAEGGEKPAPGHTLLRFWGPLGESMGHPWGTPGASLGAPWGTRERPRNSLEGISALPWGRQKRKSEFHPGLVAKTGVLIFPPGVSWGALRVSWGASGAPLGSPGVPPGAPWEFPGRLHRSARGSKRVAAYFRNSPKVLGRPGGEGLGRG